MTMANVYQEPNAGEEPGRWEVEADPANHVYTVRWSIPNNGVYHIASKCQSGAVAAEQAMLLNRNGTYPGQIHNPVNHPLHYMHQHKTGAIRSTDADGVRYDLISPIALRALAETYAEGAAKYSAYNCEKGFPVTSLLNHALRHIFLFLEGDRSEAHLAHAMWNVGMSIHSHELWPHLNKDLRSEGCIAPGIEAQSE